MLDLTRIGGHMYATVVPSTLPYTELEDFVRPQTHYGAEPFDFYVGDRDTAWPEDRDVEVDNGLLVTVVSRGQQGHSLSRIADLFAPEASWGRLCHIPRPIYTAGLCAVRGHHRFMLHQRYNARLSFDQVLAQILDKEQDAYVFQASEKWSNIDLQGDPCDRIVGVQDLPRPSTLRPDLQGRRDVFTFCDLRPIGRQPQVHFSHSFVLHLPTLLMLLDVRIPQGYAVHVEGATVAGEEIFCGSGHCTTLIVRFIFVEPEEDASDGPPDSASSHNDGGERGWHWGIQ